MLKLIHLNPRSVTWWINSFSPSHDQHIFVEQLSAKLCITGIHGIQNSADGGRYLEPSCYVAGSNKEVGSITNVIDINLSLFQGNGNYKQPDKFIQIPRNELILLPLTLVWVSFLFRITELVRHKLTTNYQQESSWDVGNELCWSQHSLIIFHVHPGVSSQNTHSEMEKPELPCAFASFFPTQMFGSTQETEHCANIVPHLCLCLSSNISNWFEAMNFFSHNYNYSSGWHCGWLTMFLKR